MTSLLITGGTGSFGRAFTRSALGRGVDRVVVYSRDELKQSHMRHDFDDDPRLRFYLGDVRDADRLRRAMDGCATVIHAAALKQVPAAEVNPLEAIKTNVLGAANVVSAALDSGTERVVALSTDKAAAPINLYGATKLCSDKLFAAARHMVGARDLRFSTVRYGNVLGSRGSVVPFFLKHRERGWLPITSAEMTRFSMTLDDAVDLVWTALERGVGGDMFVPRAPSYRIVDVATAIAPDCEQRIVGVRPGEKIHETLITDADAAHTVEADGVYVVGGVHGEPVPPGFSYRSNTNDQWLSVGQLRALIREHVDPSFEVAA